MSEAEENAAVENVIKAGDAGEIPVKEIEQIQITVTPSDVSALDSTVEKEISEIVQHSDPISPATAIPTNDAPPLSDDETPKIILNLEVSSMQSSSHEESVFNNADLNKVAMEQLDQLTQKKKVKVTQKDPLSIAPVEAEKVAPKTDQNGKSPVKLHNRILASSSSAKDYEKVVMGQTKISVEKPKKTLNPVSPSTGNEDLVAILEGHDTDDKDEVHYEVVEIIPDSEEKPEPTVVTTVLTKEEERKIALEQMSSIPKMGGRRGRKRRSPPEIETSEKTETASDLVTSLASEWSDGEKEIEIKTDPSTPTKGAKSAAKKETEEKISVETKVEPFRRTRVVKKKIIWDPDAPETQFSYASLVQSSAKKQPAQQRRSRTTLTPTPKKSETPTPKAATPTQKGKRRSETPTILNNKKKKSEIDKLLGDEGAANMLHSLENEKLEKETPVKKEASAPAVERQAKKDNSLKKRGPKPKSASSSWDYVYKQRNDDAMIIRRRSNSSYSSTSPRRLSLEQAPAGLAKKISPAAMKVPSGSKLAGVTKTVTVNLVKGKNFEFAKPEAKKIRRENDETIMTITSDIKRESLRRGNRTPINAESDHNKTQAQAKVDKEKNIEVIVKKHGNVTELHLQSKVERVKHTFTAQLMNEVVKQLDTLKGDNSCKVVFITTSGPNFCHGVDFLSLTVGTVEKRKVAAADLALSVRNFLQALASFPKPLLAGIQGTCSGLGVTMLPLFDVVISSDKSTFDTSYAKIGQIPEGHCILTLTNNVRHNFKIKLLWLSEKINSTEAALSGLVTKLTSPTKIQEDTLLCAKKVASLSQQTFSSMKAQRQKSELPKLAAALLEEQKILSQQWISAECQEKFKQYVQMQKDCW